MNKHQRREEKKETFMETESSVSASSLLCQENYEACLEEDSVDEDSVIDITESGACGDLDGEEDEYVEMLVDREINFGFPIDQSLAIDHNWINCARLDSIDWILNTRKTFGFRFQTAYLSMTYFDRFLSRHSIDRQQTWAVRLLSVACISLAAKMEEIKVPSLSEFWIEDYNFESRVIQRMELLVLNTLEWKMISITPFAFLHYFIGRFCTQSPRKPLVSRTVGFILAVTRRANLMNHRPSVIAAAATLVALDRSLTRTALEGKLSSISYSGFLEIEDVFQCYNQMQKLEAEDFKTPTFVNSRPTQLRSLDVLGNSSVASAISTKRKRLTFNASDQNHTLPDEKRLI